MLRSMELDEKLCNLTRLAAVVAAANYCHREQNRWQEATLDCTCDSGGRWCSSTFVAAANHPPSGVMRQRNISIEFQR
jgi:hypothetical protein